MAGYTWLVMAYSDACGIFKSLLVTVKSAIQSRGYLHLGLTRAEMSSEGAHSIMMMENLHLGIQP